MSHVSVDAISLHIQYFIGRIIRYRFNRCNTIATNGSFLCILQLCLILSWSIFHTIVHSWHKRSHDFWGIQSSCIEKRCWYAPSTWIFLIRYQFWRAIFVADFPKVISYHKLLSKPFMIFQIYPDTAIFKVIIFCLAIIVKVNRRLGTACVVLWLFEHLFKHIFVDWKQMALGIVFASRRAWIHHNFLYEAILVIIYYFRYLHDFLKLVVYNLESISHLYMDFAMLITNPAIARVFPSCSFRVDNAFLAHDPLEDQVTRYLFHWILLQKFIMIVLVNRIEEVGPTKQTLYILHLLLAHPPVEPTQHVLQIFPELPVMLVLHSLVELLMQVFVVFHVESLQSVGVAVVVSSMIMGMFFLISVQNEFIVIFYYFTDLYW